MAIVANTTPAIVLEPVAILEENAKLKEVIVRVNEVILTLNTLNLNPRTRDRGPKSERPMTNQDAWEVMYGPLKGVTHKKAAQQLGLSYGQVYSARGGYTFTAVKPDDFHVTDDEPKAVEEDSDPVSEEDLTELTK